MLNMLPIACNNARRGVNMDSFLCRLCLKEDEDTDHVFFRCGYAIVVWDLFGVWLGTSNMTP